MSRGSTTLSTALRQRKRAVGAVALAPTLAACNSAAGEDETSDTPVFDTASDASAPITPPPAQPVAEQDQAPRAPSDPDPVPPAPAPIQDVESPDPDPDTPPASAPASPGSNSNGGGGQQASDPDQPPAAAETPSDPDTAPPAADGQDQGGPAPTPPTPPAAAAGAGGSTPDNAGVGAETAVDTGTTDTVMAGRVTTFDLGDNVVSVQILDQPDVGNLTVNPDNTLALVLTGTRYDGPLNFEYEVTYQNGSSQVVEKTVEVEPILQNKGWSTGEDVYMLETDANGDLVIEHGDNHRVVHMSNSDTALSLADIAALEGLNEGQITAHFLMQNEEYGATPDMALDQTAGMRLWNGLTDSPGSHHLLLERGERYAIERLVPSGTQGESELHPIYIGAYGEGAPPMMTSKVRIFQDPSENVVIEDLEFRAGFSSLDSDHLILSDVISDGKGLSIQRAEGLTVRNSTVHDAVDNSAQEDVWSTQDRISGLFVGETEGLLVEGLHVDQTGWEDDYVYSASGNYGQAPSNQSQNIYIQHFNEDITFRDNISMRGASYGAQIRPGGFIEDNVFIDNNAALNALGGRTVTSGEAVRSDHFSLITDNLVTSGGGKQIATEQGALTWGIDTGSHAPTLLDNIVTHLSNPDDPVETASKIGNGAALNIRGGAYYNDTIVYNWVPSNFAGSPDRNTDGVDTNLADQTTIQNFTSDLLGIPNATIDDLGEFLRTQYADDLPNTVTADDIIAYFQQTFGLYEAPRTEAETLRFVPDDLGDGVRWDNRLNWTTDDLPGTASGDSVNLAGNWVTFATITAEIDDLGFGSGGELTVTSGRLTVDGDTTVGTDGATLEIDHSGQFWLNGYSDQDALDIAIDGGRFANTGDFDGTTDISVSDGQAILATSGADMTLGAGSRLTITGDDAKVGFDGDDGRTATLQVDGGRIDFVADATGFSGIEEFRSGALGDEPDVLSGIDLGDGVLGIDITALNNAAREDVLFGADEILGSFDTIELIGLAEDRDATIAFDYENDTVSFRITAAGDGSGVARTEFTGDMTDASNNGALWAALTDGQGTYSETEPPVIEEPDEFTSLVA